MKTAIILALTLALVGCAPMVWNHYAKDGSKFEQEKHECMMEAEQRSSNWGGAGNPFMIKDFMVTCLENRGWRRVQE